MNLKYFLIICILLPVSCNKKDEGVFININKIYDNNTQIKYSIENNTREKYVFYFDKNSFIFPTAHKMHIPQNALFLQIQNKKDSIIIPNLINYNYAEIPEWIIKWDKDYSSLFIKYKHLLKNYDSTWIYKHNSLITNKIILDNKQNYKTKTSFSLHERECESCLYYQLNSKQKYKVQIILHIDSNQIKKYLLPEEVDSLRKNDIKIFHGTLYSNKVPLVVE